MRLFLAVILPLFLLPAAVLVLIRLTVICGSDGVRTFDLMLKTVVFGGNVLFEDLLTADLLLFFHAELALSRDALQDGPRKWIESGHNAADLGAASPFALSTLSFGTLMKNSSRKKKWHGEPYAHKARRI